jgi:hypothetical protein
MDEADVAPQRFLNVCVAHAARGRKMGKQGGTRWTSDVNDFWLGMNSV